MGPWWELVKVHRPRLTLDSDTCIGRDDGESLGVLRHDLLLPMPTSGMIEDRGDSQLPARLHQSGSSRRHVVFAGL